MDQDEMKLAMKEAIKEWMDEKYAAFGKWAFASIAVAAFGALIYFILSANGWHRI